jgi:hypothetical protein
MKPIEFRAVFTQTLVTSLQVSLVNRDKGRRQIPDLGRAKKEKFKIYRCRQGV